MFTSRAIRLRRKRLFQVSASSPVRPALARRHHPHRTLRESGTQISNQYFIRSAERGLFVERSAPLRSGKNAPLRSALRLRSAPHPWSIFLYGNEEIANPPLISRVRIVQFEHQTCFTQAALVRCSLTCVDWTHFARGILIRNIRLPKSTKKINRGYY